ncbi:uncharacterized protein LOC105187878 [Harpegnathos saltator]|uniref:Cuticle protein n=1 Tax=Harpegnathos saltator TaxID=610380 RepID=E2BY77_HARSA|nr:uncharacterized protein LOC105187878 [Harpegnathos saltator]EFN79356.1 hypothetical protein EAI_09843 [Harpegnathos saltator]
MRLLVTVMVALLQVGLGSHVAVRMPYLNPAGVTYVNDFHTQDTALAYASDTPLHTVVEQPLQYAAPLIPAKVETHHVGYAAAQVPAVAAVPFVKHVPTVSQVPVTTLQAHPAVLHKQLDVVKPAVTSRKIEVRRPAIQKQFYDIEERVIVRPAGSAVVELDEPTSKVQKGSAVLQSVDYPQTHGVYPHADVIADNAPAHIPFAPVFSHVSPVSALPSPVIAPSDSGANNLQENESVVIDNPDFRNAINRARLSQFRTSEPRAAAESNGTPLDRSAPRFIAHDPSPSVVPSQRQRISAEDSKINQDRLIDLLTARGGITEVGLGRDGAAARAIGDAGYVRARVLSATPAPDYAEPSGERVSTRRVVVSRPIETYQEYDIVEPATKIERVSVQQPAFIKTARVDHVQVHGSVPVVGKALAPAVAHAAVPIYQKTISPTY